MTVLSRQPEVREEFGLVYAQFRRFEREVRDAGTFSASKLADAIHRVVIVGGEQIVPIGSKRICLTNQPQCSTGIGSEDDRILVGRGVEKREDKGPRPLS